MTWVTVVTGDVNDFSYRWHDCLVLQVIWTTHLMKHKWLLFQVIWMTGRTTWQWQLMRDSSVYWRNEQSGVHSQLHSVGTDQTGTDTTATTQTYWSCGISSGFTCRYLMRNISRVPDQNGVSQAWYIVEIHHSGWKPSIQNSIHTTLE